MNKQVEKKENPIVSILFNIVIPVVLLKRFSGEDAYFEPFEGVLIALAFPLFYGIYGFIKAKKVQFIPVLGVVSVLLTAINVLFELDPFWIAIKEAAVPLLIGLAVLISLKTKYPLVKTMLFNDQIMDVERINNILEERNDNKTKFESSLVFSSYMLAVTFLVSSILNYVLARWLVTAYPKENLGLYNEQIADMMMYSFPVIAVPSTVILMFVLWNMINTIKKLTGLSLEEIFVNRK